MIFPLLGLKSPKRETSAGHGGTETQSVNSLFSSFSVPLCLCGNSFLEFSSHGIASAYRGSQHVR